MRSPAEIPRAQAAQCFERLRDLVERFLADRRAAEPAPGAEALARQLYLAVHCRVGDVDQMGGGPGGGDDSVARIRERLAGLTASYGGWVACRRQGGRWVLTAPGGVEVQAPAAPVATGGGWVVHAPPLALPVDPAWVYWAPTTGAPRSPWDARLYLNLDPEDAPVTWAAIVTALHRAGVAGCAKVGAGHAVLRRADSAVVYVGAADVARVLALLRERLAVRPAGAPAAGFAYPAGHGIGIGLVGLGGAAGGRASFGYSWALRFARAREQGGLATELGGLREVWRASRDLAGGGTR